MLKKVVDTGGNMSNAEMHRDISLPSEVVKALGLIDKMHRLNLVVWTNLIPAVFTLGSGCLVYWILKRLTWEDWPLVAVVTVSAAFVAMVLWAFFPWLTWKARREFRDIRRDPRRKRLLALRQDLGALKRDERRLELMRARHGDDAFITRRAEELCFEQRIAVSHAAKQLNNTLRFRELGTMRPLRRSFAAERSEPDPPNPPKMGA